MPRILHIGLGNFHRAHQAWYTAHAPGDWKITGVVMRNAPLYEAMRAVGGYTLGIRGAGGLTTEWIDVHDRLILASRDAPGVIAGFADPELHVVMLTITEKGYCLTPETGALDLAHSAIRADLTGAPSGAIGLLVHGLSRRAAAGLGPLTVISCDNISGNGRKLKAAVDAFAGAAGLAMHHGNAFPDTMVDRITPATTEAISGEIAARTGRIERAPVMTEAFSEWIIEDDFAGPRPEWEGAGAELVAEVAPFEMRKLRLLNAAHSYLAYAGLLAGHSFVHQAFADPALHAAVERLWDEASPTLSAAVLPLTAAYRAALTDRFAVAEMRHRLDQIAMDGSLKLRERLVPIVAARAPAPEASGAIAAWIAFVKQTLERGEELADPNAASIKTIFEKCSDTRAYCAELARLVGLGDASSQWLDDLAVQVARGSK